MITSNTVVLNSCVSLTCTPSDLDNVRINRFIPSSAVCCGYTLVLPIVLTCKRRQGHSYYHILNQLPRIYVRRMNKPHVCSQGTCACTLSTRQNQVFPAFWSIGLCAEYWNFGPCGNSIKGSSLVLVSMLTVTKPQGS